jgi:hypothetical protein
MMAMPSWNAMPSRLAGRFYPMNTWIVDTSR